MASAATQSSVGNTLIQFSVEGRFPEDEEISAVYLEQSALPGALKALNDAQASLETEIRQISQDSAADVDTWIAHAKTIQDEIEASRRLASGIVQQAEADEERQGKFADQQTHVGFLERELAFSEHLARSLADLQELNNKLDKAEQLAEERNLVDALYLLNEFHKQLSYKAPDAATRATRLLEDRYTELIDFIHEQLRDLWKALVHFDMDNGKLTINQTLPGEKMHLQNAVIALTSFHDLKAAAESFWDDLDSAIVKPRTAICVGALPSIEIDGTIITSGEASTDYTIKHLFSDLGKVIRFLTGNFPQEFIKPVSDAMMPILSKRIKEQWLDTAIPNSLADSVEFQKALTHVGDFADELDQIKWPETQYFREWIGNVAKNFISKRRETSLDWLRNQLALGIGTTRVAEKVEKRMIERDEGMHISSAGNIVNDDWDAAWESGNDDADSINSDMAPGLVRRHKSSMEEERVVSQTTPSAMPSEPATDEDDGADAWGAWGDEDTEDTDEANDPPSPEPTPPESEALTGELREVTLSEKYLTSQMPQHVFQTAIGMYEDGATLTQPENTVLPIGPAAPGIANLSTLVLAMYRAISPAHYSNDENGNLFLYNDSMWLSDQLQNFEAEWKQRKNLSARATGMVRLEPEIKNLESFGKRAYTNELVTQRTVLKDLLGDPNNFFQQEKSEIEQGTELVTNHIRAKAKSWNRIMTWSTYASAVGSLVNAVAEKLLADIFDLNNIGADEAVRIATVLSAVESLDDLFVKPTEPTNTKAKDGQKEQSTITLVPHFVDKWFRMGFMSQVLQSNLAEMKYLWFESDLSLYFTADEVKDLIQLSFEDNGNVRRVWREILGSPRPRGVE